MGENNIKVSILTVLYNHPKVYVRHCLDSLCAQTLQECEFILIDNGANVENKALIEEYLAKDKRFKTIHLEKNVGMGAALNRGLKIARGEYIGFLESDDYADSHMFEDLYHQTQDGKIDIVKSFYQTLDQEGMVVLEKNFQDTQCGRILSRGECFDMIQGHVSHWSGIYRRDFLVSHHIDFHETPGGHSQDFGFVLKCYAFAESVYILPKAYVTYRLFSGNHKMDFLNMCMLDECELTFKFLRECDLPKLVWERLFERVGPRLKQCMETSGPIQRIRIVNELRKTSKYSTYDFFRVKEKKEIQSLIKSNRWNILFDSKTKKGNRLIHKRLWGLLKTVKKPNCKKYYALGVPLVVKKETPTKRYTKVLGCPVTHHDKTTSFLMDELEQQKIHIGDLNRKLSNLKCVIHAQHVHPETFGEYHNAFAGRDVVLVCTGPTARRYTPIPGAIHVGVNGAVYLDHITLDYVVAQDYTINQKGNETLIEDVVAYQGDHCQKFLGIIPDDRHDQVRPGIERIPMRFLSAPDCHQYILEDWKQHNIAYDLSVQPLGDFGGTTFSALQFIFYAHPKRLYLVGWDCGAGYAYGKRNAYGPANYQVDILKEYFLPWIELNYPDVEIVSINPVGLTGIFKEVYTEEYLSLHPELRRPSTEILNI